MLTYANPWMFTYAYVYLCRPMDIWVHTRTFEKIQQKRSFHHQLTEVSCIQSNVIEKNK